MIARTDGCNAARARCSIKAQHVYECTAGLEAARLLEEFQLQRYFRIRQMCIKPRCAPLQDRRLIEIRLDRTRSCANFFKRWRFHIPLQFRVQSGQGASRSRSKSTPQPGDFPKPMSLKPDDAPRKRSGGLARKRVRSQSVVRNRATSSGVGWACWSVAFL